MKGFIVGTIVTAIALYILVEFIPGFVAYDGELIGLLGIAAIFGVVNGLLGPILRIASLPVSFMTMGLVGFVINGVLLLATALIASEVGLDFTVRGFPPDLTADALVGAIVGAVLLSIVSTVVGMVVPD